MMPGVQVFEFVNVYDANAEAMRVSVDGSYVGETHLNWVAPPHFFKNGKLIVLYVGDDSTLMSAASCAWSAVCWEIGIVLC